MHKFLFIPVNTLLFICKGPRDQLSRVYNLYKLEIDCSLLGIISTDVAKAGTSKKQNPKKYFPGGLTFSNNVIK